MAEKFEKQIYLAMLAEQCSRYEDMMNFLEEIWFKRNPLTFPQMKETFFQLPTKTQSAKTAKR